MFENGSRGTADIAPARRSRSPRGRQMSSPRDAQVSDPVVIAAWGAFIVSHDDSDAPAMVKAALLEAADSARRHVFHNLDGCSIPARERPM